MQTHIWLLLEQTTEKPRLVFQMTVCGMHVIHKKDLEEKIVKQRSSKTFENGSIKRAVSKCSKVEVCRKEPLFNNLYCSAKKVLTVTILGRNSETEAILYNIYHQKMFASFLALDGKHKHDWYK